MTVKQSVNLDSLVAVLLARQKKLQATQADIQQQYELFQVTQQQLEARKAATQQLQHASLAMITATLQLQAAIKQQEPHETQLQALLEAQAATQQLLQAATRLQLLSTSPEVQESLAAAKQKLQHLESLLPKAVPAGSCGSEGGQRPCTWCHDI